MKAAKGEKVDFTYLLSIFKNVFQISPFRISIAYYEYTTSVLGVNIGLLVKDQSEIYSQKPLETFLKDQFYFKEYFSFNNSKEGALEFVLFLFSVKQVYNQVVDPYSFFDIILSEDRLYFHLDELKKKYEKRNRLWEFPDFKNYVSPKMEIIDNTYRVSFYIRSNYYGIRSVSVTVSIPNNILGINYSDPIIKDIEMETILF